MLGSGPKEPALSALMPPRPLAPSELPFALPEACGCPAALTLAGDGTGDGELRDAPAEGSTGVATAPAPAATPAAAAAPAAGPASAYRHDHAAPRQVRTMLTPTQLLKERLCHYRVFLM